MEFGSNSDREAVFKVMQKLDMKDNSGAAIVCKRAKTAMQKQRNDNLIKAEGQIKSAAASDAVIKLDWEKREIICNGQCVFSQFRESPSGEFKSPFQALVV